MHKPTILELLTEAMRRGVAECDITCLTERDIACFAERVLLRENTDPVTGFLTGNHRVAMMNTAQKWATETGLPVWYVEWDVRNVGGGNAELGHTCCNVRILAPLAAMIRTAVEGLVNVPDGWSVMFRHGGDEMSALIGGVSNDRESGRPLTRALDTLVRASYEYAVGAGLDLLPHPKHPFRFSQWGTGLAYGFAPVLPGRAAKEVFSEADLRVEHYKRGMEPGASYPLTLTWAKRRAMFGILLRRLIGGGR